MRRACTVRAVSDSAADGARTRVNPKDVPYHYGGGRVTVADALWERAMARLDALHIPFAILDDLETAHSALMYTAVEYGTELGPGVDPLLESPYCEKQRGPTDPGF
jgi:hypothetical protein